MRKAKVKRVRLGVFPIEAILPFTNKNKKNREEYIGSDGNTYHVNMASLRYETFKKSLECCCCGIRGQFFIMEMLEGDLNPHFNLYGIEDDKIVLLTKDHITPKSKGGKDHIANMQTMCAPCNELKQNFEDIPFDVLRQARGIYNTKSMEDAQKWLMQRMESLRIPKNIVDELKKN